MVVSRRFTTLAAIAAAVLALTACERKITVNEVVQSPQSCFECHSDANTFLVAATQQWENSLHASGGTLHENDSSCKNCHTSEGFVAVATGTTAPDVIANPTSIHCFTCHAPHSEGDFGLRWTANATLQNLATFDLKAGNLCAKCHQARRNVNTYVTDPVTMSTRFGPHHSNQADMLLGSNGYEYDFYDYESTTHAAATTAQPGMGGCLECHYKAVSRNVVGGHSFNMRADLHGEEVLNVLACEPCHGELDDFDYEGVQTDVDALIAQLETAVTDAGLWADGAPKAVKTSADSAGAVWNLLMAKEDRSRGVHNADYTKGLLESSIQYLQPPTAMLSARNRR